MIPNLNLLPEHNHTSIGQIAVLSIGRGDMKINFNSDDKEEVENAKVIINDMLSRGYMIFIEVNGEQVRVTDFDKNTNEYIIKIDKRSKAWKNRDKSKQSKKETKRVDAKKTQGTAIAPTGGG